MDPSDNMNSSLNCSIGDFFEIDDDDQLQILKKTNFNDVRDQVCRQGKIYNELVLPFGRSLLSDSELFFNTHI